MIQTKASKISGTIVISALLVTIFLAADAAAQRQTCECYDTVRTVSVRRAPVRRVARRTRVTRHYYTARTRVRAVHRTVYVPTTRVASYVAYADRDDRDCAESSTARVVVTEPVYTSSYEDRVYTRVSSYDASRIGRGWGRRDGFKDGYKAALKFRGYNPENNGDFRDANNGYKRRFGSKYVYKTAYREGYVQGYDSGFRSIDGGETYGVVRY